MPTHELPGHGVAHAAAQSEKGYLHREERRARIEELGEKADLVQDVYGLLTRKLIGTGTVHARLCQLADEATQDSGGASLKKRYHEMIEDVANFETELFSLLGRRLQLSKEDMEAIKTEWRLENIHPPVGSAADNDGRTTGT